MALLNSILIGPFAQVLTMADLPLKGALDDKQLQINAGAGVWIVDGYIQEVADFHMLRLKLARTAVKVIQLEGRQICLPSFIDCHTHILYAGQRANDFAMRNAGSSYLEIAATGGGIWSTVKHTRACTEDDLVALVLERSFTLLRQGITTIEVKSGYGLSIDEELKGLRAIKRANQKSKVDLVSTCLAAHMLPKDYVGSAEDYLDEMATTLFPLLKEEALTNRIDAFIEESAFTAAQIRPYFQKAKAAGFAITVHADQFTCSGSTVAVDCGALSADHLEASTEAEVALLASSAVVAVALPAASLGLGYPFTPARQLLDAGASVAIATDWNPGSAPMGQLVASASILAAAEKLTNAEVLAALTFRAAQALDLKDRGRLQTGFIADFVIYDTDNYQDITYCQGRLQPQAVWKNGLEIYHQ